MTTTTSCVYAQRDTRSSEMADPVRGSPPVVLHSQQQQSNPAGEEEQQDRKDSDAGFDL